MRTLSLVIFLAFGTTAAHATECDVPGLGRGGDWVRIQELTRAFRCIIDEIEELKRQRLQIRELERAVADLQRRVPAEYLNDNGKVFAKPDRVIGKATISADSRPSGEALSISIAQDVIEELCAARTCHITLSMTVDGVLSNNTSERQSDGPCDFSYDSATGDWDRADGCSGGGVSGTDGDGQPATGDAGADIILEAGQACLLTDTEIRTSPGQGASTFGRDRSKGLFLAAVPDRRPDLKRRFQCVLEIFRTGML